MSEKLIKVTVIYDPKKNQIRSTRQSGRMNVFGWYGYAENVKLKEGEKITSAYILVDDEEVVDE